ncbi:MAG: HAD hydrolase family protein [Vicinamibacteria bacterium]
MRYTALACDYDGTIASHGLVDEGTIAALQRLRNSGRRLILVTGRELNDLLNVFPDSDLFDRIVAENGALVYDSADRTEQLLGEPPPPELFLSLRERGVAPLSAGRVILATWTPHETTVLETIRDLGLELSVIFNKGAVMVVPSGLNKATGLVVALDALSLSPHNVVGIGDAENDHAFLQLCEFGVATANALPTLKQHADFVTAGDHGAGVTELIDEIIASDLKRIDAAISRHDVVIGITAEGEDVRSKPADQRVLIAGPSGSGKSTLATRLLELLTERAYQICILDPEGDYADFASAVHVGDATHEPSLHEVLELLAEPSQSVAVNLLAVRLDERPGFLAALLPHLQELRTRTGRPHWIVVDEAHHLLPADSHHAPSVLPADLRGLLLITVHPDQIASRAIHDLDVVLATGTKPHETLRGTPNVDLGTLPRMPEPGESIRWSRTTGRAVPFLPEAPRAERLRHRRKYAEGQLGPDKSFFFTGPDGALNLRAHNLILFVQLADGVDERTWLYHLRRGDYSRWFEEAIKDPELAAEAAQVERNEGIDAEESRRSIRAAIEERYTLPAAE